MCCNNNSLCLYVCTVYSQVYSWSVYTYVYVYACFTSHSCICISMCMNMLGVCVIVCCYCCCSVAAAVQQEIITSGFTCIKFTFPQLKREKKLFLAKGWNYGKNMFLKFFSSNLISQEIDHISITFNEKRVCKIDLSKTVALSLIYEHDTTVISLRINVSFLREILEIRKKKPRKFK